MPCGFSESLINALPCERRSAPQTDAFRIDNQGKRRLVGSRRLVRPTVRTRNAASATAGLALRRSCRAAGLEHVLFGLEPTLR